MFKFCLKKRLVSFILRQGYADSIAAHPIIPGYCDLFENDCDRFLIFCDHFAIYYDQFQFFLAHLLKNTSPSYLPLHDRARKKQVTLRPFCGSDM
ncbi:hypothetical protein AM592_16065 [Bacillus gobiensis]|uniref:Uncharacterized protein n=1 Tax=Bacillus gobiensis TaxID=1441095 RepID=A0A0M3RAC2_9BACI|nr:hypothetical protein AM592_16065 [Bacillus gobiensis]